MASKMTSSFDDILTNTGSGKFQYLVFITCSSWGIFASMQLMLTAFIVPQSSEFECQNQELQRVNWTPEEKRNFSLPWTKEGYSKCFEYQMNYSDIVSSTFDESFSAISDESLTQQKCSHWIYDTKISNSTLISEWDLVCDRHNLRSLVQSVFMAGVLVAAPIGGYMADKYGRVPLIFGGFVFYLSSGILSAFASSFQVFLVGRFVVALSGNFVYLTSYILMLEWCLPHQRSILGLVFSVPFALGYMALPIVAFYVRQWRLLLKCISAFTSILALNFLVTMESPRWLVRNGKLTKAAKVVNFARKINRESKLDPRDLVNEFSQIRRRPNPNAFSGSKFSPKRKFFGKNFRLCAEKRNDEEFPVHVERRTESPLMSSKLFKFGVLLTINWFVCNMVYYGLSLSAGNFGVDPFLYMFLGGLMEIPCYLLIVPFVVKYGRKVPLISFFGICGITVLSSLALSAEYKSWGFVVLNMFGKLNITSAFQLLYLYSSEIFPTNIRTQGVGITSMVGRLGSILSPVITDVIGNFNWRLPIMIFGCSGLVAGVVTVFLPETYARSLPDTAEDVEGWNRDDDKRDVIELTTKEDKMSRTDRSGDSKEEVKEQKRDDDDDDDREEDEENKRLRNSEA